MTCLAKTNTLRRLYGEQLAVSGARRVTLEEIEQRRTIVRATDTADV
jgi:hypothetical protein